ncbi:MAG: gamma-glutamyltransferase family protein, partial [Alphaproteobacteria bacterium]
MRDFHQPGRSTVHALNGMAATSHPLATLAAIDILRRGGNAVDAAIAASAVLCVVEPASTGIGGDCFMLYAPGGGDQIIALNGSGRAPAALNAEVLSRQGHEEMPRTGAHSVTVPGAVDAWCRMLADHGTLGIDEVLQPAIGYAEDGYVLGPRVADDHSRAAGRLIDDVAKQIFAPVGSPPKAGDVQRQPLLAQTMRIIASEGRDGFYRGAIAAGLVAHLRSHGGLHSEEDFAAHTSEYVTPIRAAYRGHEVVQVPPNGQGIVALIMLRLLEAYDLAGLDPVGAERTHLEAEATRLGYQARNAHVADQAFVDVPVERLLSDAFIEEQRALIQPGQTGGTAWSGRGAHRDTVYLTVVDRDRNACSHINSLFSPFGSGLMCAKSGVLLQNRGGCFRLEPGHPNCVGPNKRPMHTIIPGMLMKDRRVAASYGVMGGQYQPVG